MQSCNAKVEGGVAGVQIYTPSIPGVHFLMVSPGGVCPTTAERELGWDSRATSHSEVDTASVGQMN